MSPLRRTHRHRLLPALAVGVALLLGLTTPASTAAPRPTVQSSFQGGRFRAMVLETYSRSPLVMAGELRRLKAIGINTVELYINMQVASKSSNTVERVPGFTPTDDELRTIITLAHREGLDVTFTPILYSQKEQVWRGVFTPTDVDAFFRSWGANIVHYANLAQKTGVKMVAIGSEQRSLQGYADHWRRLAADVRAHYGGLVTYHSGKDADTGVVPFWDALDVVSVSGYYGLSKKTQPTYGDLRAAWESTYVPYLRDIHEATGKPVLIVELGYLSADSAAANPAAGKRGGRYNEQIQADAYAAAIDAFADEPWMQGIGWFAWDAVSTPNDVTYNPRGKIAERLLQLRWAAAA